MNQKKIHAEEIAPLLRRVTVLLADDEENQLRVMERFLRAAGYGPGIYRNPEKPFIEVFR